MDDELHQEIERALRAGVSAASQVLQGMRHRQGQEEMRSRDRAQQLMREADAEHRRWIERQRTAYKRVGWNDWRDQATLEDWRDSYNVARAMREHDPAAGEACNVIEREVQTRFETDIRADYDARQNALQEEATARARAADYIERVRDPEWTKTASATDWAHVYGVARVYSEEDPRARAALDRARDELKARGIDADREYDRYHDAQAAYRQDQDADQAADREATQHGERPRREHTTDWYREGENVIRGEVIDVDERVREGEAEERAAKLAAEGQSTDLPTALNDRAGRRSSKPARRPRADRGRDHTRTERGPR